MGQLILVKEGGDTKKRIRRRKKGKKNGEKEGREKEKKEKRKKKRRKGKKGKRKGENIFFLSHKEEEHNINITEVVSYRYYIMPRYKARTCSGRLCFPIGDGEDPR